MTNNIFNLDDFRLAKGIHSIGYDKVIDGFFNDINPKLTGNEINNILNNLYQNDGDEGLIRLMDGIQKEANTNISLSRKSMIFSLTHFIGNPGGHPTPHILYALHLANQSGKPKIINEQMEYLKSIYKTTDQINDLIEIGKILIQDKLMTESELNTIKLQLITHGRQLELFY